MILQDVNNPAQIVYGYSMSDDGPELYFMRIIVSGTNLKIRSCPSGIQRLDILKKESMECV
jgi:hypothetical protein